MNVKFSDNAVNVKITEAELAQLQAGTALETSIGFGNARLKVVLVAADLSAITVNHAGDTAQTQLVFRVPSSEITRLAEMGRSKHGLHFDYEGLEVTLQVDVRSDSRDKARVHS